MLKPNYSKPYETYNRGMPLAAIGQFCATNILAHNLAACQRLIQRASSQGAVAIFLPEASDYISLGASETLSICQPALTSPFVQGLQDHARRFGMAVNVGIHEPAEDEKAARVRNTSIWIDETGEITRRYQKVHVFDVDIDGGPKIFESRFVDSPLYSRPSG